MIKNNDCMHKTAVLIFALPFAAFAQEGAEALFLQLADEAGQTIDKKMDDAEKIEAFTARMMERLPRLQAAMLAECVAEEGAEKRAACRCYVEELDYRRAFRLFARDVYEAPPAPEILVEQEALRAETLARQKTCGLAAD